MGIHYTDLEIASLIQEKHSMPLAQCSSRFDKSVSSIKRSIAAVNEYLPSESQILINNNQAVFQMTYRQYLDFINALTLRDYYPSQIERLYTIAIYSFFRFTVNTTSLYESLCLSLSTKKKDSRALSDWLLGYHLSTKVVSKTGIKIAGDELQYRILVVNRISKNVELNQNLQLTMRQANNPLQKMLTEYFLEKVNPMFSSVRRIILQLTVQKHCRISYASMKFLFLYLSCALFRIQYSQLIQDQQPLKLSVEDYHFIDSLQENTLLNNIISALDFTPMVPPAINEKLASIVSELIDTVQSQIITRVSDDRFIFQELSLYLHKSVIRNTYHFSFYDNKLEETKEIYGNLYEIVKSAIVPYENQYGFCMSHYQISSLTLIFRKYIEKNKFAGRNQKKLVIVTNSSAEKIGFFMELLKMRVDVRLTEIININELYLLEQLKYDFLIAFSNRIVTLLEEAGYPCIKLHFYPTENDFLYLHKMGFSTSRRKLKIGPFIQEISGLDSDKLSSCLLEHYGDFFME